MVWITKSCLHSHHLRKDVKSAAEKALQYVETAPRVRISDLKDNPGARTKVSFKNLIL